MSHATLEISLRKEFFCMYWMWKICIQQKWSYYPSDNSHGRETLWMHWMWESLHYKLRTMFVKENIQKGGLKIASIVEKLLTTCQLLNLRDFTGSCFEVNLYAVKNNNTTGKIGEKWITYCKESGTIFLGHLPDFIFKKIIKQLGCNLPSWKYFRTFMSKKFILI